MRRIIFFFIFLFVWAQAAGAQSIITIELHTNGNALWIMEKQLPLINQTDINDWEEFLQAEQNGSRQEINDFMKRIDWFLLSAEKFSGRNMNAEKFNISYDIARTPSSSYGLIRYSFEWRNFSQSKSGKIIIGDTFSEGMLLSKDNVFIIKIPDGYDVEKASPNFDKRDGNRLIWDGTMYRNFGKGEPGIILSRNESGSSWLILAVILILLAGAGYIVAIKKRSKDIKTDNNAVPENPVLEDLKYEEKIMQFLIRSGGQASQSDIIKEIGLSKSRVSTILSQMKEKGQIIKIKNGSGNLIRIAKK
ncbi:MAG: winged helix-turn-helix transcriptional regulator [Candidatus Methanoperedens sp.]|nr:winged helix-turn-helix transcriptional regulator [Candidatus Methanoperedens sp.]